MKTASQFHFYVNIQNGFISLRWNSASPRRPLVAQLIDPQIYQMDIIYLENFPRVSLQTIRTG